MKVPWYESSAGATLALLLTRRFVYCNLYTITLVGGGITRYSTCNFPVTIPSYTWTANTVAFDVETPSALTWKTGTDVSTWQTVVAWRPYDPVTNTDFPDMLGGLIWPQAIRAGVLDGATVQVDRAVFSAWPTAESLAATPVGIVTVFSGKMSAIDLTRSRAVLNINSQLDLLTQAIPRNQFQSPCRHTLFDGGCALSAGSYSKNGTAVTGSTTSAILSNITAPSGSATFSLGRIVMTSGSNSGFSRAIRSWTAGSPGTFNLISPFYFAIANGDTFTAYPGCDKTLTLSTGCTGFSNTVNFGGEPYIPAQETAV